MTTHILVPVDRSAHAARAVEYALETITEPQILFLHVLEPVSAFGYGDDEFFDIEAYQQEEKRRRKRAESLLEEYRQQATDQGIAAETVLTVGKPSKCILEVAEEYDVDQIVMGSRGRSGVGRILLGSVAESVTRRSSVPVTIVR